jgi:arylsulfatase A-like enzyme
MDTRTQSTPETYPRAVLRLTLLGLLIAYLYIGFYYVGHLFTEGLTINPATMGNTFHAHLLFVIGAASVGPFVGFLASVTAALSVEALLRWVFKVEDELRRRIGRLAILILSGLVLTLPSSFSHFTSIGVILGYLGAVIITVGIWILLRRAPKLVETARKIAGCVFAAALLGYIVCYSFFLGGFEYDYPDESQGPNILVILSDAYRADMSSTFGGPVETPNLERLARMGVRYENCYSSCNWTLPSVSSIFTGLEPAVHGVGHASALPPLPTIQSRLRDSGYSTWALYCNVVVNAATGHYRGFDVHATYDYQTSATLGSIYGSVSPLYLHLGKSLTDALATADLNHLKAVPNRLAVELAQHLPEEGGVYAYIHLFDPHDPYHPPVEHLSESSYSGPLEGGTGFDYMIEAQSREAEDIPEDEKEQIRGLYQGEIAYEDAVLGRILDALEENGQLEETVIFFVGDHGEELWEHGHLGHGNWSYNESIHVPLVAYWPGLLEGGRTRSDLVSIADINPTILNGLGLEHPPEAVISRPLHLPADPERIVFSERIDTTDNETTKAQATVITPRATLIYYENLDAYELYLAEDYTQRNEVSAEYPELFAELKALLEDYRSDNAERRERFNPYSGEMSPTELQQQLEHLRAIGYIQ